MANHVIEIDHVSKQYRLGQVGTGTISHDLNRWWYRMRGKEDPYLKIGAANDRTQKGGSDYVWALRDINLTVNHGDVVGIIGRNGAGKSTLLKILSRTTAPTSGRIRAKGRIASLLEVGTCFNPELTGRDNIYLNGAIMGMNRKEIDRKFEEIVDFAGIEKYVDTPVKRYSSGMYVRLGFAVAAHLEPEILVVDEVLAVGDAEFQKKALGKMKSVSQSEGRTVLFVSHNLASLQNLCHWCAMIDKGMLVKTGPTTEVIESYLHSASAPTLEQANLQRKGSGEIRFSSITFSSHQLQPDVPLKTGSPMFVSILLDYSNFGGRKMDLIVNLRFDDSYGNRALWLSNAVKGVEILGKESLCFHLPKCPLQPGRYFITAMARDGEMPLDWIQHALSVEVAEGDYFNTGKSVPAAQAVSIHDFEVTAG